MTFERQENDFTFDVRQQGGAIDAARRPRRKVWRDAITGSLPPTVDHNGKPFPTRDANGRYLVFASTLVIMTRILQRQWIVDRDRRILVASPRWLSRIRALWDRRAYSNHRQAMNIPHRSTHHLEALVRGYGVMRYGSDLRRSTAHVRDCLSLPLRTYDEKNEDICELR